jgi:hypothetical protein
VTCFFYLFVAKEIRTLINTNDQASQQQKVTKICVQPASKERSCPEHIFTTGQGTSNNIVHSGENVEAGPSNPRVTPTTSNAKLTTVQGQTPQNGTRMKVGQAWKLRAFKMVRNTFLSTLIPSTPMIVSQIVGYIRPDLLNETVDTVISLCNVAHAIVFPLLFIVTVKN